MSTTAVTSAAPAAALETIETPEVSLQERLNAATPEEYKTWERTGDIPPVKPKLETPASEATPSKTEAAAASTERTKESSAVLKTESAAVPETATRQKKRAVDGRIQQLLDERKKEREEWEGRLKEIESRIPKPAAASVEPGSRPAVEAGKAEIKASDKEPELGDINSKTGKPFATIAEWQHEHTAWLRAQILGEVKGEFTKTEQQRAQAEQQRVRNEAFGAKLLSGKDKYPDFNKVAFNPDLQLPLGSPVDEFIRNSPHAADLLYHIGSNPEILDRFYRYIPGKDDKPDHLTGQWEQLVHPSLQMMELAEIQARLVAAPPVPRPAITSTTLSAPTKPLPPPPTVLSAKGSAAGDASEEALKRKSFSDYEKVENDRERKSRRTS